MCVQLRDKETEYKKSAEQLKKERDDVNNKIKSLQEGKLSLLFIIKHNL